VCADREEGRVVAAFGHRAREVGDLDAELQGDAHFHDALHLGIEHVARQSVLRDAEAHHPAHQRACLDHRHRMAVTAQVIGCRHA
jgi:hypothetical protein